MKLNRVVMLCWLALSNPISADQALIEKIQKSGWLEKNCNVYFKYMSGEEFKQCIQVQTALLEPYDPQRRNEFGKDYDPEKYYQCRLNNNRATGNCEKYKLVRDEPEPVWPYPDVPPIQWPAAPTEPTYKPGMSREEYFTALCEREAGEFIYKTVEDVEGVYQIRSRYPERSLYMQDPYVMEDPSGFSRDESNFISMAYLINGYKFYESSSHDIHALNSKLHLKKYYHQSILDNKANDSEFYRYFGNPKDDFRNLKRVVIKKISSRYGYIWRGINRLKDREFGIAGGEVAVVKLQNNEILGIRRSFLITELDDSGKTWWLGGLGCYGGSPLKFIEKILKVK